MLITFLEILPPNFQPWRLPKGQDESRDIWRYILPYILHLTWRERLVERKVVWYLFTLYWVHEYCPHTLLLHIEYCPDYPILFYFILSTWYSCSLLSFYFIYIWRLLTFASYNVWHYTNFPKMPSWKTVL